MATVDTRSLKLNLRDIYWLVVIVAAGVGNYYSLSAATERAQLQQDKINAVTDLRLQALSIQVEKLGVELKELNDKKK